MSIVGPRPDTPVQEIDYSVEEWKNRHTVRPGITGVAQVHLKENISRIDADLFWVNNRSVKLYLKVLIATLSKVAKLNSI